MSCRRTIAVLLMSALPFLASSFSASAETLIVTADGKEYAGDVISAGVNTLTMKLQDSGYQIVPVKSIARIQVDVTNGTPIEGKFLDWSEGEIVVRVGDRDVGIRDGTITSVSAVGVAAGGPELSGPDDEAPAPAPPAEPETPEPANADSVPTNATM